MPVDDRNLYAPPASSFEASVADRRMAPMFGYGSIVVATIFGSVLGGGLLLAMNFHALRRGHLVVATIIGSLLAMAATMAAAPFLPVGQIRLMMLWAAWLAMTLLTMAALQSSALAARRHAGVKARPVWLAFGLGLLMPIALIAIGMGVTLLRMSL